MKIAVVGAGAVGCYYGGLLAQAGHQVTLIGRVSHVEAIQTRGLILEYETRQEQIVLAASTDMAAIKDADLILVCVKSADTMAVAEQIAPYINPHAQVLSLQNGVENALSLTEKLRCPVREVAVYVGTQMVAAGHVRHHGQGGLKIGGGPGSEVLASLWRSAGIPVEVVADIKAVLWAKLIVNCAYNALSAITDQPYGRIVAQEEACLLIRNIVAECEAVARVCEIELSPGQTERVLAVGAGMAGQYSSTAQDLRRGRPTEITYLNGYIVRQGALHGVSTPLNQALVAMVRILEAKAG